MIGLGMAVPVGLAGSHAAAAGVTGRQNPAPDYTAQVFCRVCEGPLDLIANFGNLALTSMFPKAGEVAPKIPLILTRCMDCHLLQLGNNTNPALMYREGYGYKTGINESMVSHMRDVAARCMRYLKPGDRVCDIGCNDGTLLKQFGLLNVHRTGFDPIGEPVDGADIVRDYFRADERKYKLITSLSVFYDLQDPVAFSREVAASLTDDGVWLVEVGYAGALQKGLFDGICHEHLEYYGLNQLCAIADRAQLHIFDFGFNEVNGGSIWCAMRKEPLAAPYLSGFGAGYDKTIAEEAAWRWDDFERECNMAAKNVRLALGKRRVQVLGASTKGNTLLQLAGIGPEQVECAVDRNPEKTGRFTPNGIPIVGENDASRPDAYLVLPYHFRESLLARHAEDRANGVKFIFPLPRVEEV